MKHNPKRVKASEKHAKKTESQMKVAFKKDENYSKWMRKLDKETDKRHKAEVVNALLDGFSKLGMPPDEYEE